ncbi:MAG: hypothetical protein PWQ24_862, partial [Mesotoga sp.]|nr:hypothetical protein [Mesotoga sp.]
MSEAEAVELSNNGPVTTKSLISSLKQL